MDLSKYKADKKIMEFSFSLKAQLGKGSSGTVYMGKNDNTGDKVAIKVIDMRQLSSDFSLKNLISEIETMRNLQNEHIVKLLGVYQTTNNTYIITEYCDQGDLRGLMNKKKTFKEKEAVKIIFQILEGVKELQKHGIVHRDIKPANVLINNNMFKLTDFGFARKLPSNDIVMDSLVGTPLYMSPQILFKQKYNSKSEIWSIAMILYEMLQGATAWPSNNLFDLTQKIRQSHQVNFNPTIPLSEDVKDFIRNCLKIDEKERFEWEQVYSHRIFDKYRKQAQEEKKLRQEQELQKSLACNELKDKILKIGSYLRENKDILEQIHEYLDTSMKLKIKTLYYVIFKITSTLTEKYQSAKKEDPQEFESLLNSIDLHGIEKLNCVDDLNVYSKYIQSHFHPQKPQENNCQSQQQQHFDMSSSINQMMRQLIHSFKFSRSLNRDGENENDSLEKQSISVIVNFDKSLRIVEQLDNSQQQNSNNQEANITLEYQAQMNQFYQKYF